MATPAQLTWMPRRSHANVVHVSLQDSLLAMRTMDTHSPMQRRHSRAQQQTSECKFHMGTALGVGVVCIGVVSDSCVRLCHWQAATACTCKRDGRNADVVPQQISLCKVYKNRAGPGSVRELLVLVFLLATPAAVKPTKQDTSDAFTA